jgi:hypothetical protein
MPFVVEVWVQPARSRFAMTPCEFVCVSGATVESGKRRTCSPSSSSFSPPSRSCPSTCCAKRFSRLSASSTCFECRCCTRSGGA